jgi:hypothetical protein
VERAEVEELMRQLRAQREQTPSPVECPTCKAIMADLTREIVACRDRIAMETLAEVWSRIAHAHGLISAREE